MLRFIVYCTVFLLCINQGVTKITELIVLSAPSVNNSYYADRFIDMIKFHISYAKILLENNEVIVLADKYTIPYLTGDQPDLINDSLPRDKVLASEVPDVWIRDFGTVVQNKPVMLGYNPGYLDKVWSEHLQNSFIGMLKKAGIQVVRQEESGKQQESDSMQNATSLKFYPDLVVDGGNVVDNMVDTAILTDRIMQENKGVGDKAMMKEKLKAALGYKRIVIISQYGEIRDDTTGHSDGLVSFIDTNVVAFGQLEEDKQDLLMKELEDQLGPDVKLVELPSFWVNESDYHNFTSSCGTHANSLVTRDFVYVPVYGQDPESQAIGLSVANDDQVLNIIKSNTKKTVVKVPVPHKVCILGGAARCLSMQIEGPIADRLIQAAKESAT